MTIDSLIDDPDRLRRAYAEAGQEHVFQYWDDLDEAARQKLLSEAAEIDLTEVNQLVQLHLKADVGDKIDYESLEPAPYIPHPEKGGDQKEWNQAHQLGEEALRCNQVAAFTVAGGQGSRLGYEGPKGTFPATPVNGKTLFQVFAEKLLAAQERYQCMLPWFIMTSHANHEATREYFQENNCLGLNPEQLSFFMQGRMPAVDPEG